MARVFVKWLLISFVFSLFVGCGGLSIDDNTNIDSGMKSQDKNQT